MSATGHACGDPVSLVRELSTDVWGRFGVMASPDSELKIAGLGRRFAAGLIDAFSFTAVAAAAIFTVTEADRRVRVRARRATPDRSSSTPEIAVRWTGWMTSSTFKRGMRLYALVVAVWGRNWLGPGGRLLGIRRVDARTGGPISVRGALVHHGIRIACGALTRRVYGPWEERARAKADRIRPELKAIQAEHVGEPEAQQDALMQFYKANNVNPLSSCAPRLPELILTPAIVIYSPRHQSLADRAAGIDTIDTRRRGNR